MWPIIESVWGTARGTQVLTCILLKYLVVGKLKPGRYPLFSAAYFRWWLVRQVLHATRDHVSDLLGGTPLLPAFCK